MKRTFSFFIIFLGFVLSAPTMAAKWEEGVHYSVHSNPMKSLDETVVEWFWIGSSHCESLEPIIGDWRKNQKPDDADFLQIPASFNKTWMKHAKVVYVLDAAGALKKQEHRQILYKTVDKNSSYYDKGMEELAPEFGTSVKELRKAGSSKKLKKMVNDNMEISRHYQGKIDGVPFIVVEGKYMIDNENVQQEKMPELINHLLSLDES